MSTETSNATASHRGRVWKLGDGVSTDALLPGHARALSVADQARHCMAAARPGWADLVRVGDILVAGRNFGCGSGRPAPRPLIHLGIRCVLAESVARLFQRNAVNAGLAALACPGIVDLVAETEELEVDVETGWVTNLASGARLRADAFPPGSPPAEILRAGGLDALLLQRLARRTDPDVT